jgi:hypothetical protein
MSGPRRVARRRGGIILLVLVVGVARLKPEELGLLILVHVGIDARHAGHWRAPFSPGRWALAQRHRAFFDCNVGMHLWERTCSELRVLVEHVLIA